MGFGLTISKMIVQHLNGEIFVSSIVNKGSNFEFEIKAEAKKPIVDASIEELSSIPSYEYSSN